MAKTPTKSTATVPVASNTTVAQSQDDAVVTIPTVSDPSGSNGPDGNNSQNTPPSSGDAASDASANLVKPQVNADQTGATTAEAANGTLTPEVEASASGTISDASQGEEDGTGANAGSVSSEITIAELLASRGGFASVDELLDFAEIGMQFRALLLDLVVKDAVPSSYLSSATPVDVFRDLIAAHAALRERYKKLRATLDDGETRFFVATGSVRLDGVLFEAGEYTPLTRDQHKQIAAAGACDPDWENGE